MINQELKKLRVFRIVGWSMVVLPTFLLLCVVVDLLFFSLEPWQYGEFGLGYVSVKESIFWVQYTNHCENFSPKWIISVVWHFSWWFSLLGIKILAKYEQRSNEKWGPFLLNQSNAIQLILLTIGTYAQKFKRYSLLDISPINILIYLIILPPFSILPQFFLSKISSRGIIFKSDYVIIPMLGLCLLLSFLFFGRSLCMV